MTKDEEHAHRLIGRLRYLLARLEGEFFHVHPDLELNGATTSLALSSILNEALNLHEAVFRGDASFWSTIRGWGDSQQWEWSEIEIRFTCWPVLENLKPFGLDASDSLVIAGRDANNSVKHRGQYASLRDAIEASATAWFLVLEKAREAGIYLDSASAEELLKLFDCFEWISIDKVQYGMEVRRPMVSRVEYPAVRGRSEMAEAREAFERRWERHRESSQEGQLPPSGAAQQGDATGRPAADR